MCMRVIAGLGIILCGAPLGAQDDVVTNPIEARIAPGDVAIQLAPVADGLGSPVWGTSPAGDARLFIVDQYGQVRIVQDGKMLGKPFLDVTSHLTKLRPGFDERGLLGLAFHPGFGDPKSPGHRKLYTYSSDKIEGPADFTVKMVAYVNGKEIPLPPKFDHQSVIAEWQVSADDPNAVDPSSRRVLMRVDQPQFNHDGGTVVFGPDGMLYIGFGDGGAGNDFGPGHSPGGNGQDTGNVLGSIVRIDPLGKSGAKSKNGQYSIPADNPLVGRDGLDEIYAWGQRNPWRISFDSKTGELIAADVGQESVEEINLIEKGGNYGWPVKEGHFFFDQKAKKGQNIRRNPPAGVSAEGMIGPIAQYDHDDGISITGGFVYRGKAIPALLGKYVFGEWNAVETTVVDGKRKRKNIGGRLFYADLKSGEILEFKVDGPLDRIGGFGQDASGELYVLTNTDSSPVTKQGGRASGGKVWKILPR